MSNALPLDAAPASASARSSLDRAIRRWHFDAGLRSVPLMILLAVTGSICLLAAILLMLAVDLPAIRTVPPLRRAFA